MTTPKVVVQVLDVQTVLDPTEVSLVLTRPVEVSLILTHPGVQGETGPPGPSSVKYSANIGDGVSTQIDVVHGLGTEDVLFSFRRVSDGVMVIPDWDIIDANTVRVGFLVAPSPASIRATVYG